VTLAQDVRTVKEWCRSARRKAERGAVESSAAVKSWATGPIPDALKHTRGHDLDTQTGECECGNTPVGQSYREHLIHVLDIALFLRVPAHVRGEGW